MNQEKKKLRRHAVGIAIAMGALLLLLSAPVPVGAQGLPPDALDAATKAEEPSVCESEATNTAGHPCPLVNDLLNTELTSETQCSTLNTVCATAIAVAVVQCGSKLLYHRCDAVGTAGGHGLSPAKLDGELSWSGTICSATEIGPCKKTTPVAGFCDWNGLQDAEGCGNSVTEKGYTDESWGTKARAWCYVTTTATATTYVFLPLVVPQNGAPGPNVMPEEDLIRIPLETVTAETSNSAVGTG